MSMNVSPTSLSHQRPRALSLHLSLRLSRAAVLVGVAALASCKSPEEPKAPESSTESSTEAAASATLAESASAPPAAEGAAPSEPSAPSIHGLTLKRLDGTEASLSKWAGQVLLVVNTASKCGYTPQYEGLQQLHTKYSAKGFEVLGFPSNDFGGQEPGTAEEISNFCISMYDVNFPMFEKTKTIGADKSPLYALLSEARGEPKWNFHKYLVDKRGRPVQAWPSKVEPGSPEIAAAIEAQLAAE